MPDHYNFEKEEGQEFIYTFSTHKNINYRIAFTEDHIINSLGDIDFLNTYALTILRDDCERPGTDPIIKLTILEIIKSFFSFKDKCVVFICDDDDLKARGRYSIFSKWYDEYNPKEGIIKHDNVIYDDKRNIHVYTSLMYHNGFPNSEIILDIFNQISNIYKNNQESA